MVSLPSAQVLCRSGRPSAMARLIVQGGKRQALPAGATTAVWGATVWPPGPFAHKASSAAERRTLLAFT